MKTVENKQLNEITETIQDMEIELGKEKEKKQNETKLVMTIVYRSKAEEILSMKS